MADMIRQTQFLYILCFVLYLLILVMYQWRGNFQNPILSKEIEVCCTYIPAYWLFPNGYNLSQHKLCEDVCRMHMVDMELN